jgi:hypothetical protein
LLLPKGKPAPAGETTASKITKLADNKTNRKTFLMNLTDELFDRSTK